jgi:hypothetical protein
VSNIQKNWYEVSIQKSNGQYVRSIFHSESEHQFSKFVDVMYPLKVTFSVCKNDNEVRELFNSFSESAELINLWITDFVKICSIGNIVDADRKLTIY